jgi:hypothetical protein
MNYESLLSTTFTRRSLIPRPKRSTDLGKSSNHVPEEANVSQLVGSQWSRVRTDALHELNLICISAFGTLSLDVFRITIRANKEMVVNFSTNTIVSDAICIQITFMPE